MEKKPQKRKKEVKDDKAASFIENELENSNKLDLNESVKLSPKEEHRVRKLNVILDKRKERTHKSFAKLLQGSPKSDSK